MARIDKAPEGGKFRATAAAGLDGTAGAWGDARFLNVALDANGQLAVGGAADVDGFIDVSEGQNTTAAATVIGGRVYTVFFQCEIIGAADFANPAVSAGDVLWAKAAGDVGTTGALGDIFMGTVLDDDRVVINMNGKQPST